MQIGSDPTEPRCPRWWLVGVAAYSTLAARRLRSQRCPQFSQQTPLTPHPRPAKFASTPPLACRPPRTNSVSQPPRPDRTGESRDTLLPAPCRAIGGRLVNESPILVMARRTTFTTMQHGRCPGPATRMSESLRCRQQTDVGQNQCNRSVCHGRAPECPELPRMRGRRGIRTLQSGRQ